MDSATGYTMLIPTNGCDGITVINSIIKYWIPIFGWFSVFESDWGSGFNNKLMKIFMKLSKTRMFIAEPRNHRSIGKVERRIGIVQRTIQHLNMLIDKTLTDNIIDYNKAWMIVETILPFIQFAMNQRRPRFTTISPNMLIFGRNMNDISDNGRLVHKLQQLHKKKEFKLKNSDFKYIHNIIKNIQRVNNLFKNDWQKYTWLSNEHYKRKWKITPKKIKNYMNIFKVGKEVLYYIGDKKISQYKWRQRYTGPWTIDKIINESSLIIGDPTTGNQKRVSFDRIKLFKRHNFQNYEDFVSQDEDYIKYQKKLLKKMTSYNVETREKGIELDYNIDQY